MDDVTTHDPVEAEAPPGEAPCGTACEVPVAEAVPEHQEEHAEEPAPV